MLVPPQPVSAAPTSAAPRSRIKSWPVLGAIGLACTGGAVALVLAMGRGGGAHAHSIDDAVKRTFAALGAGDAEALVAGGDMDYMHKSVDCTRFDRERDKRERADMRAEFERAARRERGAKFEVRNITTTSTETAEKGKALGPDCKLASPLVARKLDVALAVTRDGARTETHATMGVIELDGAFLVVNAPKIQGCSLAIARIMLLEARKGSSSFVYSRCEREKWSADQISCVANAVLLDDIDRCLNGGRR
jgi:hypothetical protein